MGVACFCIGAWSYRSGAVISPRFPVNEKPMTKAIRIQQIDHEHPYIHHLPLSAQHHQLLFVRSGSGLLDLNYQQHQVQPQRVFLLPSNEPEFQIDWSGTGWLLTFEDWLLRAFFQQHPGEKILPLFQRTKKPYTDVLPATGTALHTLAQMLQQEQSSGHNPGIAQAYLHTILLHLTNAYRLINEVPQSNLNYQVAEKLIPLIRENFRKERLPAFYATRLGMPVRKLNRISKSATGKLVLELISEQLLTEAETLLAESPLSIKEIAYDLDFSDMAQFNHFMKRHTNRSPTDFRQQVQG